MDILNQRTSIRWGAIAALSNCSTPPYPTMAGARIYDSRQEAITQTVEQRDMPMATVYTDADVMVPINENQRGVHPSKHQMTLVVELSMTGDDMERITDANLELRLDTFEAQVMRALTDPTSDTAAKWFTTMTRIVQIESQRLANDTYDHRLAQRDLVFTIQYQDSCYDVKKAFPNFDRVLANLSINDQLLTQATQEIQQ